MSNGQERVLLELKTIKELTARLTSAGDKMEKKIKKRNAEFARQDLGKVSPSMRIVIQRMRSYQAVKNKEMFFAPGLKK